MPRRNLNKPATRSAKEWRDKGYSEASVQSHRYRGGLPKTKNSDLIRLAHETVKELLTHIDPEVRLKAAGLVLKNFTEDTESDALLAIDGTLIEESGLQDSDGMGGALQE